MTEASALKTILVVEDEDLVREMTVLQLQDAGYEVLEAPTTVRALEILNSDSAIALVFTDVNMPGDLDGLQLAAMLKDHWPNVRLIVTSGGGKVRPSEVHPPARFMPKPYSLEALVSAVRQLHGRGSLKFGFPAASGLVTLSLVGCWPYRRRASRL